MSQRNGRLASPGSRRITKRQARRLVVPAVFVAAVAACCLGAGTAGASTFCPPGTSAGQCETATGVATDFQSGRAYVADDGNNRIDVFQATDGGENWEFLFAFGWNVNPSGGSGQLETCTTDTGCQAGISGSGAGQMNRPRWIAVDNTPGSPNLHDVFVVDDNRVNHFNGNGGFEGAFGWGVLNGSPQLQTCTTASGCLPAVELPSKGIAGECQLGGIQQPIAVGPGGNLFVGVTTGEEVYNDGLTAKVQRFGPDGSCLGQSVLWAGNNRAGARVYALAVDDSEDLYTNQSADAFGVYKYDFDTGAMLCNLDSRPAEALTRDGSGHLFVMQTEDPVFPAPQHRLLTEFDDACNKVRRVGYGEVGSSLGVRGIAPFQTSAGDVLFTRSVDNDPPLGVRYLKFPDPGPLVARPSVKADPVRSVSVRLRAEINPEGEQTTYRVEWVDQSSFEADGFDGPNTQATSELPLGVTEFELGGVEVTAGCKPFTEEALENGDCLDPRTSYRYRVIAKNPDGEDEVQGAFTTRAPLEIESTYASRVGTDTATLGAVVNPLGSEAGGYFEYVEEAAYLADVAAGGDGFAAATRTPDTAGGAEPLDFGAGEVGVERSASPYPLREGTTYRYRLVATDPFETIAGPVLSFATFQAATAELGACPANEAFRAGPSALLPDCRAHEMVSPVDKDGGDIVVLPQLTTNEPAVLNQSSVSGDRFTYGSYRAFGDDVQSAPYTSQYLAERRPGGWSNHGLGPVRGHSASESPPREFDLEFTAFSPDLCTAWLTSFAGPPLAAGAGDGHRNLYRRSDRTCGPETYTTLTNAEPEKLSALFKIEPQGSSDDGQTTAFAASDTLLGSGAPAQPSGCVDANEVPCRKGLYVKGSKGKPRYACILPGGSPTAGSCVAGTGNTHFALSRSGNLTNALSSDGSFLYWTDSVDEGRIYVRRNPLGPGAECSGPNAPCTRPVSTQAEAASGTSASRFWAAAEDGSATIFTTGNAVSASADLYRFELVDEQASFVAGEVLGVLGTSADATRTYFASREAIADSGQNSEGDEPRAGQPNLYLHVAGEGGGSYRFVATLADADVRLASISGQESSATAFEPRAHNGRVSPSGLQAAFMSRAPLTGYDNTDVESGAADTEVFVYDDGAGELLCVSCNPSGGRPSGTSTRGTGAGFWVAARLPTMPTSQYGSNLLSTDGRRLFFESRDALVARDTNGRFDVYQWQRPGKGSCGTGSASYSPAADGCIDLISSGRSERDSTFLDASPTGDDVFFATLSSLYPSDYGLVDVYDARVGGGFPAPVEPAPSCEGEACQAPYSPPTDPSPSSLLFRGAGNELSPAGGKSRRCPKGKRKVKRRGGTRCVKRQVKRGPKKQSRKQAGAGR